MSDHLEEPESGEEEWSAPKLFRAGMILEGGMALAAAAAGWLTGVNPTATILLTTEALPAMARAVGWGVLAVAPMALVVWLIDRYPVGPLREFNRMVGDRVTPLFAGLTVEQMALLSLAAGIGEEMLFRGFLQVGLEQWIGSRWLALAGASLAFGFCHYISTTYFILTTLIGAYLGLLFLWTGNLLAPIAAHALYDFLALLYLLRWKPRQSKA